MHETGEYLVGVFSEVNTHRFPRLRQPLFGECPEAPSERFCRLERSVVDQARTALILLTPAELDSSLVILKCLSPSARAPVWVTWGPPQISRLKYWPSGSPM